MVPTTRPGAAALAAALDDLRPYLADGPLTLITASMADKDVDGVIEALVGGGASGASGRALAGATIVCTSVPGMDRALPADELAARWSRISAGGQPAAGLADEARRRRSRPSPIPSSPSTGRSAPAEVPSSWRVRSILSAWPADTSWTTPPCATRNRAGRRHVSHTDDGRDHLPQTPPPRYASPAPSRIGPRTFRWGERTFVMGILNITPDSFSGDGLIAAPAHQTPWPPQSRPRRRDGRRRRRPARHRWRIHASRPRARRRRRRASPRRPGHRGRPDCPSRRPDQRRYDRSRPSPKLLSRPGPISSTTCGASARQTTCRGSPRSTASLSS